jgi:serine/threonine-protein kinase
MRTCPTCNARYEPPAQFCQRDGTPLVVDMPPQDPYLGTKILGQFRLQRVIGSGGMGIVYEGWDEGLQRRVAVKILHRDLVTNKDIVGRFHREAQIAHQLDHPGIVRVILFGQLADGNLYLVLEFLEGPTLLEALEKDQIFAPGRAVKIASAVADAIGYAHAREIVHRDLKPENIILTRRDGDPEFPKVLDFGIAKCLVGNGSFVTQAGLIFGTARYISPEGAAGEPVDQRGDVYSLGVIAYQLLTGRTPFEADEPVQLLIKHMHDTPPPMSAVPAGAHVPSSVEAVVMRALAKNPDTRFDDGAAFARALREAAGATGLDLRSIVPTTAMPLYAPQPVTTTSLNGETRPELARPPHETLAPRESPAPAEQFPIHVSESSGISVVRTVRRATESSEPRVLPSVVVNGSMLTAATSGGHSGPVSLPPRMELPVIVPPTPAPADSLAPPPPSAPPPAPSVPRTEAMSSIDDLDDIQIAGLPRKKRRETRAGPSYSPPRASAEDITVQGMPAPRGTTGRTLAIVMASVIAAVLLVAVGAYAFRMFPTQRRQDDITGLLQRADEALSLGRYVHASNGSDVEDLTDAVLALEPGTSRAFQLSRSAAARLKTAADAERVAHHPERAVPLIQDAIRLVDDPALREDLAAAQRELDAQRTPTPPAPTPRTQPPRPTPAPAPSPTPRANTPRTNTPRNNNNTPTNDDLNHPPQVVVPIAPTIIPPPSQVGEPVRIFGPQQPQQPPGQVLQNPLQPPPSENPGGGMAEF